MTPTTMLESIFPLTLREAVMSAHDVALELDGLSA
jgi:hypothetical protein